MYLFLKAKLFGEIGIKLHITDCQPITDGVYSSMNYFLAQVREKFDHQIFRHTNLLTLKWYLEEENNELFSGFILERIEPDLILIVYPDSIDQIEELNSAKYQLENCIQKYFDTVETRVAIGVNCFKIQLFINDNNLNNAINEWKSAMIPIAYNIENSEKNFNMIHLAKLAQNQLFQNDLCLIQQSNEKMISLIPDFLVYLKQLQSDATVQNDDNFSKLLIHGIKCMNDMKEFKIYLQTMIGKPIDPKGLRCQLISMILQILNDLIELIKNIYQQIITPLFQITPGCETLQQIAKKKTMKNSLKQLIQLIQTAPPPSTTTTTTSSSSSSNRDNNNNNDYDVKSMTDYFDMIPASLQCIIRDENFEKYGWMLCITSSLLISLRKIDLYMDEYFFSIKLYDTNYV
ncbi:unnamed protein product [Schistosoma turkestanicum]|nr:unnamed protein product [Schistosoma turkestanicum]